MERPQTIANSELPPDNRPAGAHLSPDIFVAAVLVVQAVFLLAVRGEFSLTEYPFLVPDSFDWLVNGLSYSNLIPPFEISHRPLLFPFLSATLFSLGARDLIPFIGTVALVLGAFLIYTELKRIVPLGVATLTTLLWGLAPFVVAQSAYVGADVLATVLISFGIISVFSGLSRKRPIVGGLVVLALSAHAQYIACILLPTLLVLPLIARPKDHGSRTSAREWFFILAIPIAILVAPLLWRFAQYHVLYVERVQHLSLLSFSLSGITYYLPALPAVFSWPVIVAALYGAWSAFRISELRPQATMFGVWFLNVLLFFAVFYSWLDIRFLIYLALPVAFFAAVGLQVVLQKALFSRFHGTLASLTAGLIVVVFILAGATISSGNPFEFSLVLSPSKTLIRDGNGDIKVVDRSSTLYWTNHLMESRKWRRTLRAGVFDGSYVSQPLARLLGEIRETELAPIMFYDELPPERWYVEKNRTTFYAGVPVEVADQAKVLCARIGVQPFILVTPETRLLSTPCGIHIGTIRVLFREGRYTAALIPAQSSQPKDAPA